VSTPSTDHPEPLVRARLCQEWLASIATEEDPYRSRFLTRVTNELRAEIDGATGVSWIPLSIHVKLADIQLEAFGAARAHDYYRRVFSRALTGPFLGPLVRTGARVLGVSLCSFVRWASKGYQASYKNAGVLDGEVLGPGHARVVFRELPSICVASEAWLMSAQGSAYGLYDVLGLDGVVRLNMQARAERSTTLELEWSDRKMRGKT
jgi:hypothetical protein